MAAGYLPITVERNGSYLEGWQITDDAGAPLDITGWTFEMAVKYAAGDADPPLALFTVTVVDLPTAQLEVKLLGSALVAVPGEHETVKLAYDFIAKDAANVPSAYVKGPIYLEPGVSTL